MSAELIFVFLTIFLCILTFALFYRRYKIEGSNFNEWLKKSQFSTFEGYVPYINMAICFQAFDHPTIQNALNSISNYSALIFLIECMLVALISIGPFLLVYYISSKSLKNQPNS